MDAQETDKQAQANATSAAARRGRIGRDAELFGTALKRENELARNGKLLPTGLAIGRAGAINLGASPPHAESNRSLSLGQVS
ncbi:MAG TPA: hypothetical protein VGV87_12790 [Blastocatellia bacterium]|nr:hypothetical protein [Blastocatellia bacterium]